MNDPCRTVLKQLLLPAMVTTRALNSALFIIFHTHFCPLQFKVFQGCLKWCIMRLVNLSSHWGEILSKEVHIFIFMNTNYYSLWHCSNETILSFQEDRQDASDYRHPQICCRICRWNCHGVIYCGFLYYAISSVLFD